MALPSGESGAPPPPPAADTALPANPANPVPPPVVVLGEGAPPALAVSPVRLLAEA